MKTKEPEKIMTDEEFDNDSSESIEDFFSFLFAECQLHKEENECHGRNNKQT